MLQNKRRESGDGEINRKNDETYFYPHCFEEECIGVSKPCSECEFEEKICIRLGEYEDTGLTPEQIMALKEGNTAKRPIQAEDGMVCPECGSKALPWQKHCDECGQRFWEVGR